MVVLIFLESLIIVLLNMITLLMMSAKMPSPGLLKIRIFWNYGYDVIISVHDVTTKILSCDSNCIIDVAVWPMFGKFSISMRNVIITSIVQGLDQKNGLFWGEGLGSCWINWGWHQVRNWHFTIVWQKHYNEKSESFWS